MPVPSCILWLCVTSGKARILFHLCVFYNRVSGGQGEKQDYMETSPLSVEVGSYCPLTFIIAVLFVTWLGWGLSKSRAPSCSWNAGLRKEDKYAPPSSITIVFSWNQTEIIQRTDYRKEVIKIQLEEYTGGKCFLCFVQVVVVMKEELVLKARPFLVPASGPFFLFNTPFTHLQPY